MLYIINFTQHWNYSYITSYVNITDNAVTQLFKFTSLFSEQMFPLWFNYQTVAAQCKYEYVEQIISSLYTHQAYIIQLTACNNISS